MFKTISGGGVQMIGLCNGKYCSLTITVVKKSKIHFDAQRGPLK